MSRASVVVPARNEEELLPRCLSALRKQEFDDFEIIVVDSASTDHTRQVAESFGARVIRLEEPGVARARQAGFEAATGKIIVSTDADAISNPDWLQRIIAPFNDLAVIGTFGTIELSGQRIWTRLGHAFFSGFQAANLRLGHPLFCGLICGEEGCIPRCRWFQSKRRIPRRSRGCAACSEAKEEREDSVPARQRGDCIFSSPGQGTGAALQPATMRAYISRFVGLVMPDEGSLDSSVLIRGSIVERPLLVKVCPS